MLSTYLCPLLFKSSANLYPFAQLAGKLTWPTSSILSTRNNPIQHKVPDEDTPEIEHEPYTLTTFYTPSYQRQSCKACIHGACREPMLKEASMAQLDRADLNHLECSGGPMHTIQIVYM